jgi:hypothetical protein
MLRRIMLILVLCLGVSHMIEAKSEAACKMSSTGKYICSSPLCTDVLLKGIGNPDKNAIAVCVSLSFDCEGWCWNPAGQAVQADGDAFKPQIELCASDLVEAGDLTGERGTAYLNDLCFPVICNCDLCGTDDNDCLEECNKCSEGEMGIIDAIIAWVDANTSKICPNDLWEFDPKSLEVVRMYSYYSTYELTKNKLALYASNELCGQCEAIPQAKFGADGDCGLDCWLLGDSEICKERSLNQVCAEAAECLIFGNCE